MANEDNNPVNQQIKLGLILTTGILAMSSASILIRWAQGEGVSSLIIATYRLTIATGLLTFPMIQQRGWREYATLEKHTIILILTSGVLLGLHFATWITSLKHVSVMSSAVLVSMTPLWVGLASPLLLSERIPALMWISLSVTMLGASLIGLAGWKGAQLQAIEGDGECARKYPLFRIYGWSTAQQLLFC